MEKTEVKPGKVFRSAASRWCREDEAPFNTVLGIPGAVFLYKKGEGICLLPFVYQLKYSYAVSI